MANDFVQKPESRYNDLNGITDKKLSFGLWYVRNRQKFVNAGLITLGLVSAICWTYAIYHFGYYLIYGMAEDDKLVAEMAMENLNQHQPVEARKAKNLEVYKTSVFASSGSKYDFLAQISNLNIDWVARFTYFFTSNGQAITKEKTGYIFPEENKFFLSLAQDLASRPVNVSLVLSEVSWLRVDKHLIPNWKGFNDPRMNFIIRDIDFKPAKESGLSDKLPMNQLDFNITNNTAYNYWAVNCKIILYAGGVVAAINEYTVADFMSGQSRDLRSSWPGNLPRIDKIEVLPEVNLLDENSYIKFDGGTGEIK